ncbi:stress responsive alpha-beta barrel domain protein isoform X2 [Wolffia australiana]
MTNDRNDFVQSSVHRLRRLIDSGSSSVPETSVIGLQLGLLHSKPKEGNEYKHNYLVLLCGFVQVITAWHDICLFYPFDRPTNRGAKAEEIARMFACGNRLPLLWTSAGGSDRIPPLHPRRKSLFQVFSFSPERQEALRPRNANAEGNFVCCALNSNADSVAGGFVKKRGVVEHIYLLKAKPGISEDEEKNMLDYLYTTQYQMRGILSISLGRIADENSDGFTHAIFMRFQKKEDLRNFYSNSGYLKVLNEYVIPYCYGSLSVDFESDVEDDILTIFRRGEEFNCGVEFVLLISVNEDAAEEAVDEALTGLRILVEKFNWLIVQATHGPSLIRGEREFTHGAVIRFPSEAALESFKGCSDFKELWSRKLAQISQKILAVHFAVDPVGTDLM